MKKYSKLRPLQTRKDRLLLTAVFITCAFFFNTTVSSGAFSGAKNLDDVLNEVEKANAAFKTMQADIIYTRTITLLESSETSQGEMKYKKPDRLHLKFAPPRDEVNILDGKNIWIYHPKQKQAEKYAIDKGKHSSQGLSFFEFGYGESVAEAKKDYKITLVDTREDNKKRFYILDLLPKDPKSQYSDIRLWIEDGFWLPVRLELYESAGEIVNVISLKNIRLNKGMSDKLFIFDVPRGVEVVEPLN